MKKIHASLIIVPAILMLVACEKENRNSEYLYFPAGRSFMGESEIRITMNDSVCKPEFIYDSCGGYWIGIHKEDLPENRTLQIQYIRVKEDLLLFLEPATDGNNWLTQSFYIDCDHDLLKTKAVELTKDLWNNIDKAKRIQQFVISHLELKTYKDSFLEKASVTYELGYGTCMNFSRLFIALCRAADIPARSVWGVIYGYNDDNIYDYHHQWAEIQDEQGYWHQTDFNYTKDFDLNNIRYLDLIYAAEENSFVQNNSSGKIELGDVEYFNGYPATLTGRLGFELVSDNRPDSMTIQYTCSF